METLPQPANSIREVARLANTSVSTVSRVLNNSGYVKADVRSRIEAVIAATGYVPSAMAKDLRRRQSSLVGVVIPRINSYTSGEIVAGLSSVLSAQGYSVLLANTDNHAEREIESLRLFQEKRVNGVLLLATELTGQHKEALGRMAVPTVVIGQDAAALPCSCVLQDERAATRTMARELIRLGHRRIGLIGVHEWDIQVGVERKQGYLDALAEADIAPDADLLVQGSFEFASAATAVDRLLALPAPPSALLAVTDRLAIGAISRLAELGLRVPQDMSVVGMGDIDLAAMYQPRISTVHYDYFGTGCRAAELLMAELGQSAAEPQRLVMDFRLMMRDSARSVDA
jgi:LacI family sucrose operon transcriptional repressor